MSFSVGMPSSIRCSGGSLGRLASQRGRHNVEGSGAGTRRSGDENRRQRDGRIPMRIITVALIAEMVTANAVDGRISDAVLDTIENLMAPYSETCAGCA